MRAADSKQPTRTPSRVRPPDLHRGRRCGRSSRRPASRASWPRAGRPPSPRGPSCTRPVGGLHPRGRRRAEAADAGGQQGARRRGRCSRSSTPTTCSRASPPPSSRARRGHHPDSRNWPHLYANALVDVSDVANSSARPRAASTRSSTRRQGQRQVAVRAARDRRQRRRLPEIVARRRSARRSTRRPGRRREAGRSSRPRASRTGRRSATRFGDAPTFTYPLLWAYGGAETDKSGKKVVLNSKGAVESVKFMQAFWKDVLRRGRAGLGRHEQQPRLSRRGDLRPR